MTELIQRSVYEHAEALAKREYSATELLNAYLAQIEKKEPVVGAFLTLDTEVAIRDAMASDARRARGESRGAFDGIP